ncbi:hypothetical protein BYT27DRAFT_7118759, partial [Phlegmacium glaucopus]
LLLPPELKHHITKLSSPHSLASLARTHTAYQREAEQALYHTLSIRPFKESSLICLETLATNPEKAGFVRFLTMECAPNKTYSDQQAMAYLFKALVNMRALSDFRSRMCFRRVNEWIDGLGKILPGGYFELQTLFCNDELDMHLIIKSQIGLKTLGIYGNGDTEILLNTLECLQLCSAQLTLPMVFTLERESFMPRFDHISIFPAFYAIDRSPTIRQVLVKSLQEGLGYGMSAVLEEFFQLSVYLVDSSDISAIHALAKDMIVGFPHISWLNFYFKRGCERSSLWEMKKVLSCFADLSELTFRFWPGEDSNAGPNIPLDTTMAHVKEWEVASPELREVTFMDGTTLQKSNEGEWVLFQRVR